MEVFINPLTKEFIMKYVLITLAVGTWYVFAVYNSPFLAYFLTGQFLR